MARRKLRCAAYGIVRDPDNRLLLVRAAPYLTVAGRWFLPGGGLEHGETPEDALRREIREETGLVVDAATLLGVTADTSRLPDGISLHTVRIVYRVDAYSGDLRPELVGSSDDAAWWAPAELEQVPLVGYVEAVLARFDAQPATG